MDMEIRKDILEIPGADLFEENPLPMFRAQQHDQIFHSDGTLTPEGLEGFGLHTGFRVLPYGMQDRFTQNRTPRRYETIVMENDVLRAEFLPQFGGRLYSLWNKREQRELLFKNPVFQPANLAIRNAWFSGGVEWNVGQLGHAYHTCDDVHFARCRTEDGEEFLRMYDYVRTTGLFWQVDFHMPEHAGFLYAHVRVMNDGAQAKPMYWWTNTAVPEDGCRVFSGNGEVIYINAQSLVNEGDTHCYGRARMPHLPSMPDTDVSYPLNFEYTSEYFFQNPPTDASPWEAAVYPDGFAFFERSTQPLRTRKMFCWGRHSGGRNWLDHLSEPGKGAYVEIQAGLTPTQSHGADIAPHSEVSFTQAFGCVHVDSSCVNADWDDARRLVGEAGDGALAPNALGTMHVRFCADAEQPCVEVLHRGHGWAAVENARRTKAGETPVPAHLAFEVDGNGPEAVWAALVDGRPFPPLHPRELPRSWIVDDAWRPLLEQAARREANNPAALVYLGVLDYENERYDLACECWEKADRIYPTVIALRCLAAARSRAGDARSAVEYMRQAFALEGEHPSVYIAEELLALLLKEKRYAEMWELYSSLPPDVADDERLVIQVCPAALEMGQEEFLEQAYRRPFAVIREGENQMCEVWFRHQALLEARRTGRTDLDALTQEMRRTKTPPKTIDYRLAQA